MHIICLSGFCDRAGNQPTYENCPEDGDGEEGPAALTDVECLCPALGLPVASVYEGYDNQRAQQDQHTYYCAPYIGVDAHVGYYNVHPAGPTDGKGGFEAKPAGVIRRVEVWRRLQQLGRGAGVAVDK